VIAAAAARREPKSDDLPNRRRCPGFKLHEANSSVTLTFDCSITTRWSLVGNLLCRKAGERDASPRGRASDHVNCANVA
jgi:hypothetical protein